MGVEIEILAALFAVAIVAGCFDAIAGGGGLLTVPALLLAGLDPVAGGRDEQAPGLGRHAVRRQWPSRAAGSSNGVRLGRSRPSRRRRRSGGRCPSASCPGRCSTVLVPLLLVAIALYFATARGWGMRMRAPASTRPSSRLLVAAPIGFYDGVFGPGAGSFYDGRLRDALGYGILKATAHTKLANAASNGGSLVLFAATGAVHWPIGLAMAAGAIPRRPARLDPRHPPRRPPHPPPPRDDLRRGRNPPPRGPANPLRRWVAGVGGVERAARGERLSFTHGGRSLVAVGVSVSDVQGKALASVLGGKPKLSGRPA
jgi:hypothetical protein